MLRTKTALFGGTFDPVHRGHIDVARSAVGIIGAEKLLFVPAKRSALKKQSPAASDSDRLEMIRLSVAGVDKFEVSDRELQRPAPSYTIDTVRHFKKVFGPGVELYWLIGADSVAELEHWYKIEELIDECFLTCMYRAGYDKPDFSRLAGKLSPQGLQKLQDNIIETPLIDISSTQIRARLARGQEVGDMLSPAVANYIREHQLYH